MCLIFQIFPQFCKPCFLFSKYVKSSIIAAERNKALSSGAADFGKVIAKLACVVKQFFKTELGTLLKFPTISIPGYSLISKVADWQHGPSQIIPH